MSPIEKSKYKVGKKTLILGIQDEDLMSKYERR